MKNIHIGGVYYGRHNIGDEAILYSMIKSFEPSFNISVSTYESNWIKKDFPQVERRHIELQYVKPQMGLFITPRKKIITNISKLNREIKFLKTKDAYICGGATILSDCPWYSLRTVQVAGKAGLPVYLWGVGMTSISNSEMAKYIIEVLNRGYVKKIYTRDEIVADRLKSMGVAPDKLGVSYDPAIMLLGEESEFSRFITKTQLKIYNNGKPNFVLTISGEDDVIKRTPLNEIINAVNLLQKKYDANLFLIPTGCGQHCKDLDLLKEISLKLISNNVSVIDTEFSPNALVAFLKNVNMIISSRLHMNIFGACATTPSIGLVRNDKIVDFAKLNSLPYLELFDLTQGKLVHTVEQVMHDSDMIKEELKKSVTRMRNKYTESLSEIQEFIDRKR